MAAFLFVQNEVGDRDGLAMDLISHLISSGGHAGQHQDFLKQENVEFLKKRYFFYLDAPYNIHKYFIHHKFLINMSPL